jgi:hypothetical protein
MKIVKKIIFNFWLFSGASMNNTREKPIKTISDVKVHETYFL